jgi:arylsulfatase A-like enzyme
MSSTAAGTRGLRVVLPCLAVAAVAVSCAGENSPPPSVILAVFDTTRFDDWSYLRPEPVVTPVLDELAAGAQRFSNAYSLYTATVPSHVTMFTGHSVLPLGSLERSPLGEAKYGYRKSSLFTILGERRYRTYAFSGNKNVRMGTIEALKTVHVTDQRLHDRTPVARLERVLRAYGEYVADPRGLPAEERRVYQRHRSVIMGNAESVNAAALAHMRDHAANHAERPFFLFVNYNDAHDPYFPEPPFDTRFGSPAASRFNGNLWSARQRRTTSSLSPDRLTLTSRGLSREDIRRALDLHLGELAYADQQFGVLLHELDALGLMESTVIIGVSDHGELFGEYGRMAHSGAAVEELVHVPMFILFPGGEFAPATIDARVDLRDIKPTLLAYIGIEDDSSRGRSLLPLLWGEEIAAAVERPSRGDPAADGAQRIGGQDLQTTEELDAQLRELGYAE